MLTGASFLGGRASLLIEEEPGSGELEQTLCCWARPAHEESMSVVVGAPPLFRVVRAPRSIFDHRKPAS